MHSTAASSHVLEDRSSSFLTFFSRGLGCELAKFSSPEKGVSEPLSQCYPTSSGSLLERGSFPQSPLQLRQSFSVCCKQAQIRGLLFLRWELSPLGALGSLLWLGATVTASQSRPEIFPFSCAASTQGAVLKRSLHSKGKRPTGIFRIKGKDLMYRIVAF